MSRKRRGSTRCSTPLKERTNETLSEPTRLQSGLHDIALAATWNKDRTIQIKKVGPLSATVLGLVSDIGLGGA